MEPHINLNNIKLKHAKNDMVNDPIHVLRQVQGSINIIQIIFKMRKHHNHHQKKQKI